MEMKIQWNLSNGHLYTVLKKRLYSLLGGGGVIIRGSGGATIQGNTVCIGELIIIINQVMKCKKFDLLFKTISMNFKSHPCNETEYPPA